MSKAEQTRQTIIEKASVIFNEKGIAGTSIDDVLKAAKVAKGCLYGHFASKEDLSYACVDYMLTRISERRNNALDKEKTAKAKIFAFMDNNKNPLLSYIDGGCPIVNLSAESDDTNPVIKKKVRKLITTAIKLFTDILHDGIAKNEFSDCLKPEEFALKMFMSIEGANAICRVINSAKPMQQLIHSLKAELDSYSLPG
ncbi:TetR/AcrR family transcriptional regulator [Mucilaginibacter rigui]|uniref:TetR/AcrR family transcriptional regulator n=1 Tax=Mucilaginibacter rigui TaxID=534635 RepID=A0ABR7X805_9SPHI|nr:TetR/AcrR family transcriptional regulator [Mucilaginibacter rigui]MBD1385922.1 TetR/AcrR family transcriptional regulator [Mucilaginibacter rigui]